MARRRRKAAMMERVKKARREAADVLRALPDSRLNVKLDLEGLGQQLDKKGVAGKVAKHLAAALEPETWNLLTERQRERYLKLCLDLAHARSGTKLNVNMNGAEGPETNEELDEQIRTLTKRMGLGALPKEN